jgi:competence protein ComEC
VGKSASYNGRDKVTLENVNIYGVDKNKTPKKVRISSSVGRLSVFNVGDWVAVEAKLRAPGHPRHKGDYNFRMRAWMDEIGATGYVMGQVYKTSWPVDYKNSTYKIQHIRNTLTEKIVNVDDVPPERAVMAALITGKKTYISAEIYNAYRSSGLAHLLAISGLHIGLIGGFFFFSVRRLFGLSERITLRYNTKIPAALIAIVACLAYTALAGGTLPTLRAFIMATFIFIGFIVGRLHNTLRIFMMTLTLVLLLWPESLLTASFQMSFAAVFALTLWNELKENNMHSHLKIVRGMTYTKGVFLTSVVAGLATMPIAAWHFGEIHFTGFVVNVLAIPLTAFVVMPSALLSVMAVPFSAEGPFLKVMEYGVGLLNELAIQGANFPYGHYVIEQGEVVLLAMAVLLLLLCLYMNKFKKIATFVLISTVVFAVMHHGSHHNLLWLRGGETILMGHEDAYIKVRYDSSSAEKRYLKYFDISRKINESCDSVGCVFKRDDYTFLVTKTDADLTTEDCLQVDFIIAAKGVSTSSCPHILQVPKGAVSGKVVFKNKNVLFVPFTLHEKRIWH